MPHLLECNIRDVTEGLLGRIFHCYIWEHGLCSDGCCLRVQEKYRAGFTFIQSSSIDLFNSGSSNSVRLCLTLDSVASYHQVQEGLLSASGAVELVKKSKMYIYMYIYMYYLLA